MTGINIREHVILLTMKLSFANQTITKRLVLLIRKILVRDHTKVIFIRPVGRGVLGVHMDCPKSQKGPPDVIVKYLK